MNRIILIGNGFDLAHNLKTKYKHFIDNCWNKIRDNIPQQTKEYDAFKTFESIYEYEDDFIKMQSRRVPLYTVLNNPKNNNNGYAWFKTLEEIYQNNRTLSIQHKNSFFTEISKDQLENWVDIEYKYYQAMLECLGLLEGKKKRKGDIKQLNDEFSRIQKALEEYLKTQIVPNEYVKEISDIIYSPSKESIRVVSSGEKYDNIFCINFNYTDTTKLYFREFKPSEIIHIHGELNNPENPIIFGYGDEMDEQGKLIENKNEDEYLKNNKSIKYLQTGNYQELLGFIEADEYQIFTMGHSCGISDRTLLNTLFEHDNCKKIKPFYYQWKDGDEDKDNYNEIIINIYRNFKDKKKCRARVEPKENCEPLPQLKPE